VLAVQGRAGLQKLRQQHLVPCACAWPSPFSSAAFSTWHVAKTFTNALAYRHGHGLPTITTMGMMTIPTQVTTMDMATISSQASMCQLMANQC